MLSFVSVHCCFSLTDRRVEYGRHTDGYGSSLGESTLKTGSIVTMVVNFDAGTLEYEVDGSSLGSVPLNNQVGDMSRLAALRLYD